MRFSVSLPASRRARMARFCETMAESSDLRPSRALIFSSGDAACSALSASICCFNSAMRGSVEKSGSVGAALIFS
jgi:hypothetical protein